VGGLEHPHDTPPYTFMPSPTFAHSSGHSLNHRKVLLAKELSLIRAPMRLNAVKNAG
jgi:hypothetical protein